MKNVSIKRARHQTFRWLLVRGISVRESDVGIALGMSTETVDLFPKNIVRCVRNMLARIWDICYVIGVVVGRGRVESLAQLSQTKSEKC